MEIEINPKITYNNEDISDTEVPNEDANVFTNPEYATIDENQAKKRNKALKEVTKLKSSFSSNPSKFG